MAATSPICDGGQAAAFRRRAQAVFQDPYSQPQPVHAGLGSRGRAARGPRHRSTAERRERASRRSSRCVSPAIDRYAHRYPHTLSGGQRQRVNIARAMMLEPDVRRRRRAGIDDRCLQPRRDPGACCARSRRRKGALVSCTSPTTWPVPATSPTASRCCMRGRVVELADARELIDHPLHPYSRALLAAVPEPDPANRTRLRPVVSGEPPSVTPSRTAVRSTPAVPSPWPVVPRRSSRR